eukprot:1616871-Amphidinium_carterae.1
MELGLDSWASMQRLKVSFSQGAERISYTQSLEAMALPAVKAWMDTATAGPSVQELIGTAGGVRFA